MFHTFVPIIISILFTLRLVFISIYFQDRETYVNKIGRYSCSGPGIAPSNHAPIECPLNCKIKRIWKHDFDISQDGKLTITANRSLNTQVYISDISLNSRKAKH